MMSFKKKGYYVILFLTLVAVVSTAGLVYVDQWASSQIESNLEKDFQKALLDIFNQDVYAEKMLVEEDLGTCTELPGEKQGHQDEYSTKKKGDLQDPAPLTAVNLDVITRQRHQQHVQSGTDQGGRVQHHAA